MRGQGLPITVIIVAALGILVLIVIAAIFGGQIGKFSRAANECQGRCVVNSVPEGIPVSTFTVRSPAECNQFEKPLSGFWYARGMPQNADPEGWMCDACCLTI